LKILFIAPLPPPVSGNSLPVKILAESVQQKPQIELDIVRLNKKKHGSGFSLGRVQEILHALLQVFRKQKNADVVYLTLAESLSGNIRDLVIMSICRNRLSSMVAHMFGGAGMRIILERRRGIRFRLNRFFLSKLGAVVVEGETQQKMFSIVTDPKRIHVVKNFAEDYLFLSTEEVRSKFDRVDPVRVLFLSNMLWGKGHMELLQAYRELAPAIKEQIVLDFAGKLVSGGDEFLKMVESESNVTYHGPVYERAKRELYAKSHVFCLPTYYPFEGQPFCIIEAYATGCVVVSTRHSGIPDVFEHRKNGFAVEKRSVESLTAMFQMLLQSREQLLEIATRNLNQAKAIHTQNAYLRSMTEVLETTGGVDL
jgi:glycosyltransferase involved in cell wall biosynthesis